MPKIAYQEIKFRTASLNLIEFINDVIADYENQGYSLTLRQLYYQLVSKDIIENTERSYKNIGNLVNNGRLAGLIDWYSIEDRTRFIRSNSHWDSTSSIIYSCASQFAVDKWEDQENYVEVWVEKDALIGIIQQVCSRWDVSCFSCRGYVSQSEMWQTAQRLKRYNHKNAIIIHLGDHDPSGIDMSRDIVDRLNIFGVSPYFERIALNMDQIEQYTPPPNPAKLTDSRCKDYINKFGRSSWELDALEPNVLDRLIESYIMKYIDKTEYDNKIGLERKERFLLQKISENLDEIRNEYL